MAQTQDNLTVEVETRTERGKNACRRLRKSGKVPGNVYGLGGAPFAVAVAPKRVEEVLRLDSGRNTLLNLALDGGRQARQVMIRELQRDPMSERLVHIDFVRVDPKATMELQIPVNLIGVATGVKNEGGVLDFVNRTVAVSCLPSAIPPHLDVDISELHVGQHVAVKDLVAIDGVTVEDDAEMIIAVVAISKAEVVEEEAAAEEEAEAAEPKEGEAEAEKKDADKEGSEKA